LAFGISIAIALGEDGDVEVLRDRLARYRGHHVCSCAGQVAYCGPVELWLGIAALHGGELDAAVHELDHAVQTCAANGAAGYHVEAGVLLATALAKRGERGDVARARSLADSSRRAAAGLGMDPFVDRAEQVLRLLVHSGPLTPREWEVAQLVAQGWTNRQIAVALSLSERTAQNHVQHILTKLGLANRSQITAWVTAQQVSSRS
jgi:DNA-binding NarL/FixJ family response regulator